jgi:hypothetical protein
MSSIAQTCQRHLPSHQPWRPDMLLGEVRDLRPRLHLKDPDTFGAALALSTIACPGWVLDDRDLLLQHIASQTRQLRSQPAGQDVSARIALAAGTIFSRKRMLEFYRRRLPVSAGLSNLDLTQAIKGFEGREQILDFWRVSPTGPIMPLAIASTTLGGQFNLSVTWRKSLFTPTTLDAFVGDLVEDIRSWIASTIPAPQPLPAVA